MWLKNGAGDEEGAELGGCDEWAKIGTQGLKPNSFYWRYRPG